jgi:hypothetical protein
MVPYDLLFQLVFQVSQSKVTLNQLLGKSAYKKTAVAMLTP